MLFHSQMSSLAAFVVVAQRCARENQCNLQLWSWDSDVLPKITALSRHKSGLWRQLLGSASHFQSSLCLKTAKKCLHSRLVWQKSGQLNLGTVSFPPNERLYQVSLDSGDLTWNSPLFSLALMYSGLISSADDILFKQWTRNCLGLSCRNFEMVLLYPLYFPL